MVDKILKSIDDVSGMYYRLILLVGDTSDHKLLAKALSDALAVKVHNVNLEISKDLLHKTERQRKLDLPKVIRQITDNEDTVILDHTEILFDVKLGQDPLRLLESLSRNKTLVVFWNGRIEDGKLIYAESGHPEYRSYSTQDLVTIKLNEGKAA